MGHASSHGAQSDAAAVAPEPERILIFPSQKNRYTNHHSIKRLYLIHGISFLDMNATLIIFFSSKVQPNGGSPVPVQNGF